MCGGVRCESSWGVGVVIGVGFFVNVVRRVIRKLF